VFAAASPGYRSPIRSAPRVRSHSRFGKRGTDHLSESGTKRMSSRALFTRRRRAQGPRADRRRQPRGPSRPRQLQQPRGAAAIFRPLVKLAPSAVLGGGPTGGGGRWAWERPWREVLAKCPDFKWCGTDNSVVPDGTRLLQVRRTLSRTISELRGQRAATVAGEKRHAYL
jgi:hypothetical protein